MISNFVKIALKPRGKQAFIRSHATGHILDVGCGNNAPYMAKQIAPSCHYTGIDIGDYNQTKPNLADQYILTDPEHFPDEIARHAGEFDAVMSAHNLEHCDDREATLMAMISALRPGGDLFLAFPSARSVNLPSRQGTLNYYDDKTHKAAPPDVGKITAILHAAGLRTQVYNPYRPALLCLFGLLVEPLARWQKRAISGGTWALYGFETVIWAHKPKAARTAAVD